MQQQSTNSASRLQRSSPFDVLVTGAAGFIGSRVCERFRQDGRSVFALDREGGDVANPDTWAALPPAKAIIHCAARTFVPHSWEDPTGFLHVNVLGTQCALEYCRKHGARMVFISAYVYGIPAVLPIDEKSPRHPNNPYALSKHLAEQLCLFYRNFHGVRLNVLRLFNVYGPGQQVDFLIPMLISQVHGGERIKVQSLGSCRDYVFVDDVIDAVVRAAAFDGDPCVFNIGSGISLSTQEVIDTIQSVAKTDLPVDCEHNVRVNEIPDVRADVSAAKEHLAWVPSVDFRVGIARMLGMGLGRR